MTNALVMELTADPQRARKIAAKILELAEGGDMTAAKILFDRLEGKAVETIDHNIGITVIDRRERMQRALELQAKVRQPEEAEVVQP